MEEDKTLKAYWLTDAQYDELISKTTLSADRKTLHSHLGIDIEIHYCPNLKQMSVRVNESTGEVSLKVQQGQIFNRKFMQKLIDFLCQTTSFITSKREQALKKLDKVAAENFKEYPLKQGDITYMWGLPYHVEFEDQCATSSVSCVEPKNVVQVAVPADQSRYAEKYRLLRAKSYYTSEAVENTMRIVHGRLLLPRACLMPYYQLPFIPACEIDNGRQLFLDQRVLHWGKSESIRSADLQNSFHTYMITKLEQKRIQKQSEMAKRYFAFDMERPQILAQEVDWLECEDLTLKDFWPYSAKLTIEQLDAISKELKQGKLIYEDLFCNPYQYLVQSFSQCYASKSNDGILWRQRYCMAAVKSTDDLISFDDDRRYFFDHNDMGRAFCRYKNSLSFFGSEERHNQTYTRKDEVSGYDITYPREVEGCVGAEYDKFFTFVYDDLYLNKDSYTRRLIIPGDGEYIPEMFSRGYYPKERSTLEDNDLQKLCPVYAPLECRVHYYVYNSKPLQVLSMKEGEEYVFLVYRECSLPVKPTREQRLDMMYWLSMMCPSPYVMTWETKKPEFITMEERASLKTSFAASEQYCADIVKNAHLPKSFDYRENLSCTTGVCKSVRPYQYTLFRNIEPYFTDISLSYAYLQWQIHQYKNYVTLGPFLDEPELKKGYVWTLCANGEEIDPALAFTGYISRHIPTEKHISVKNYRKIEGRPHHCSTEQARTFSDVLEVDSTGDYIFHSIFDNEENEHKKHSFYHQSLYVPGTITVRLVGKYTEKKAKLALQEYFNGELQRVTEKLVKLIQDDPLFKRYIEYEKRIKVVGIQPVRNHRWAECYYNNNKLRVNPFFIHLPLHCNIALLAHEIMHLKYPTHGKDFRNGLRECFPDHEFIDLETSLFKEMFKLNRH